MSEFYNVNITITCIECERFKKLEYEVWRFKKMIEMMVNTSDDDVVNQYGEIRSSITKVGE